MAFSGAGVFNRIHNWISDRDNGIKITAVRHDAEDDGFATGLSNCICRDGQSTVTAAIPFGSQRITQVGNATADTDAVNRQTGDERWSNNGECYLSQASTTALVLTRKNGKKLVINGLAYDVPNAGVTYTLAGLTGGNVYNVFAYMVGSTMTLEANLTTAVADATSGITIKSGDSSRTYVGRFLADTATTMTAESATAMRVLSYYQRVARLRYVTVTLASANTGSYTLIAGSALGLLSWADETVQLNLQGYASNATNAGHLYTSFAQGGSTFGGDNLSYAAAASQNANVSMSMTAQADGAYQYDVRGAVAAGTGLWTFFFMASTRG